MKTSILSSLLFLLLSLSSTSLAAPVAAPQTVPIIPSDPVTAISPALSAQQQAANAALNTFLLGFTAIYPVGGSITEVSGVLTTGEAALAAVEGAQTTRNDVVDNAPCKPVTVIFARGTTEPGNVGVLAGPPFFDALRDRLGGDQMLAVQGVGPQGYPATIDGFLAGGEPGAGQVMADLAQQALSQCPDTKVVLSGYSQGGQITHHAAALLPSDVLGDPNKISSIVIFGDPLNGTPIPGIDPSRVRIVCHVSDGICLHTDLVLPEHLTYAIDAPATADFVATEAGY